MSQIFRSFEANSSVYLTKKIGKAGRPGLTAVDQSILGQAPRVTRTFHHRAHSLFGRRSILTRSHEGTKNCSGLPFTIAGYGSAPVHGKIFLDIPASYRFIPSCPCAFASASRILAPLNPLCLYAFVTLCFFAFATCLYLLLGFAALYPTYGNYIS